MPGFVRIGRSGYLLFVATYIIDVNAHCWPFIKTPPYIRSTPLEDFIPPYSRRTRALFPHPSRSLGSSSHSPPPPPPPPTNTTTTVTLRQTLCTRLSLDLFFRRANHPFLWWKRTSPPLDTLTVVLLFSSTPFFFSDACSSLLFFLSFHELISSRELTHASSFRPSSSGRSSVLVPDVPPSCQLAFSSSSSFAPTPLPFPSPAGGTTTSSLL